MKIYKYIAIVLIGLVLSLFVVFYIAGLVFGKDANSKVLNSVLSTLGFSTDNSTLESELPNLEVYTFNDSDIQTYESVVTLYIESNNQIKIKDQTSKFELKNVGTANENFRYVLKINNIGIGKAVVNIPLVDDSAQEVSKQFTVDRILKNLPFQNSYIPEWENTEYVSDPDDLLANVSKSSRIVSTYSPQDLIYVKDDLQLYTDLTDIQIRADAGFALKKMLSDLFKETNINLNIRSGYRSYNDQVTVYSQNAASIGTTEADKISARPGYSEHQLGTTVDFVSFETNYTFTQDYGNTTTGKWLQENSWKYGFVLSYPESSTELTGYQYEPWHYRYIGAENASKMNSANLNFPEWINSIL